MKSDLFPCCKYRALTGADLGPVRQVAYGSETLCGGFGDVVLFAGCKEGDSTSVGRAGASCVKYLHAFPNWCSGQQSVQMKLASACLSA